jgi:hypothetical protein
MKFQCNGCGNVVVHPDKDFDFYFWQDWLCNSCYSVIVDGRYEKNIKGGKTVFFPTGRKLGDKEVFKPIKKYYLENNPDEHVIFLDELIGLDVLRAMKPDKVFWANLFSGEMRRPPESILYYITTEANKLNKMSYHWYPTDFDLEEIVDEKVLLSLDRPFVLFHLRNRRDSEGANKNIKPWVVYRILVDFAKKFSDCLIVFIGNDFENNGLRTKDLHDVVSLPMIDLRNALFLSEISWLANHKNCLGFIGRDSGMGHFYVNSLKNKNKCNAVVWDFETDNWFLKCPVVGADCFTKKEFNIDLIMDAIRSRMMLW